MCSMAEKPFAAPSVITGRHVRLEALRLTHAAALLESSRDPSIWTFLTVPQPVSLEEMEAWIRSALDRQTLGLETPFAVFRLADDALVGTTRYMDIKPFERSLEIGWTWYAPDARRTAVNTECKLLLLSYAFETLEFNRVQLKTDALNERSRRAIERIGAKFEGILRNYQRYWHGGLRDTAMYAMTDKDWPPAKAMLEKRVYGSSGSD